MSELAGRSFASALGGLTLVALAVRLAGLHALGGFDWDEVATVFIAARPLPDLIAYLRGAPFEHPPLYYALAHAWLAFGRDEPTLRTLSALLGTVTVPLIGLVGAELFGRRAGLTSAVLLALAPAHVYYSRDARMYPLLALLLLLGLFALARAMRPVGAIVHLALPPAANPRPATGPWWTLWVTASLLALATHYYAAIAVGGQVLYLLATARGGRAARLALGATLVLTSAALAGWWALAPGLRHSLDALRPAPLALQDSALSLWRATGGVLRGPFAEEPPLVDEIAAALALGIVVLLAVASWRRHPDATRLLLFAGLAPWVGLIALMPFGRDLNARFLLMLLPVVLLAAGAGWSTLAWPRVRAGPADRSRPPPGTGGVSQGSSGPPRAVPVILAAAWGLLIAFWFVPYYRDYVRGDYALAVRQIEAAERAGEAVVFNGPWQTLLFDHYYRGALPTHVLTGEVPLVEGQAAAALADLSARYHAIWLLETDMGHADPSEFVPRWLGRYAFIGTVVSFRQVRLAHYLLPGPALNVRLVDQAFGTVVLQELAVEPIAPRPGAATRVELVWRAAAGFEPGLKVSARLCDPMGVRWWAADVWLLAGWLPDRPPRVGDALWTRLAATLPPEAPATPYALEFVVYRSTERPESGQGWIDWSAPAVRLALDGVAGGELVGDRTSQCSMR